MKLYKYRTVELTKLILVNRRLRASNFSRLNDPFDLTIESLFDPSFAKSAEEVVNNFTTVLIESGPVYKGKNLSEHLQKIQSVLKKSSTKEIENYKNELIQTDSFSTLKEHLPTSNTALAIFKNSFERDGIVCFSKRADINPLWAHYAENHTGIVLGFKADKDKNSCLLLAQEVTYQDERPMLAKNIKEYYQRSFFYSDVDNARDYVDRIHYTKCKNWDYEEELRLILPNYIDPAVGHYDLPFLPHELEEIYFGSRANDSDIQLVRQMAKTLNPAITFYHMAPDKYSYKLLKREI